jgi:uncharacterized protein YqeY
MSLISQLQDEITVAMKERDTERRDALRLVVNAPAHGGEGPPAPAE